MSLDRDPALAFQVHRVEQLILFVALMNRARSVEQSIGERGLAVIDMRDDAEISGQLDRHKAQHYAGVRRVGQLSAAFALLSFLLVILIMILILSYRSAERSGAGS
jgi:hypothetical protein